MRDDEKQLRAAFDELRRVERSGTPSFRRVWTAAQDRGAARSPRRPLSLALAAVSLLVVMLLAVYRFRQPAPPMDVSPPLTALNWTSPTDFLLDTPGSALGGSIPRFSTVPNYSLVILQKEN